MAVEVGDRDVLLDVAGAAEQPALVGAGEMQGRLAERLRRDGARVDLGAAEDGVLLDDGDALAQLGRLDGALLPRGAGADDDAVEVFHDAALSPSREGRG